MEFTTIDKFNTYHKWLSDISDIVKNDTSGKWHEIIPPFYLNCLDDPFDIYIGTEYGFVSITDDCKTIDDRIEEAKEKNMVDVFLKFAKEVCDENNVSFRSSTDNTVELVMIVHKHEVVPNLNRYINALNIISNVNLLG